MWRNVYLPSRIFSATEKSKYVRANTLDIIVMEAVHSIINFLDIKLGGIE
jgi:hypothetical protein